MRILYFTRDYCPHDHRFLSSLAKTGHEIYLLRLERRNRQLEDRTLPPEVNQINWRGGQAPFTWREAPDLLLAFRQVLRQVQPDLVHAGPVPSVAFLAAFSGARPLVSMSWGSDLLHDIDGDRWQRWCARFALQRSRVLVGDCQAVKDKAVSLGFPAERVKLFPWGVDLDRFAPPSGDGVFRGRRGWENAFVLLSLRSWEPIYGVDVVVQAFGRAAQQIPDLRLILLGNGSQAVHIRELILEYGLEEKVFLGGQVKNSDLPGYYQAADLYLSASHSDGSSVSLMEALASGRPVLVSDIPGNKEWITPGREGWLFTDGDVEALAAGIVEAYNQRKKLAEMGAAARSLAEQRADWRKNFQVLLGAYELAMRTYNEGKKK